jgi:hypothetical protein
VAVNPGRSRGSPSRVRRLAGRLRGPASGLVRVLTWPPGALLVSLWRASRSWPRRAPDLARLTRRADLGEFQAVAARWLDRHFELIEAAAPWLDRAGRSILDRCRTTLGSHPFSFPRDPPSVSCDRAVTVVYGFEGSVPGRLDDLAVALVAAGWGNRRGQTVLPASLGQSPPPAWPLEWSPVPALGLPPGLERIPPDRTLGLNHRLDMGIGWISRGEPAAELTTTRQLGWPGDPRVATPLHRPVEVSGPDVAELAARALEKHPHAVAIRIEVGYYLNVNTDAGNGRLRKRLRPVH